MTFMTKSGDTLLVICRMGFNHRLYNVRVDGLMELSHTHTGKAIIVRYRDTGLIDIKLTGAPYYKSEPNRYKRYPALSLKSIT